jgi:hypothetical protein
MMADARTDQIDDAVVSTGELIAALTDAGEESSGSLANSSIALIVAVLANARRFSSVCRACGAV